jgi:hypothetical protein
MESMQILQDKGPETLSHPSKGEEPALLSENGPCHAKSGTGGHARWQEDQATSACPSLAAGNAGWA